MLTLGCFAQSKSTGFRDVFITFTNQQQPDDTYKVINADYPGNGEYIEYEWFFESPTYTRVLKGQIEWRRDSTDQLIATQNFRQTVDYSALPISGNYRVLHLELDRVRYYKLPDFQH